MPFWRSTRLDRNYFEYVRVVELLVVVALGGSRGTVVHEVNKQLPTSTKRAEITSFFIGL